MRPSIHGFFTVLLLAIVCGSGVSRSEAEISRSEKKEYQVKAGFVFNFLKFISWPPDAETPNQTWRIGIIGDVAEYETIRDELAGRSINGHPVVVSPIEDDLDLELCHVVFITAGYTDSSVNLVEAVSHSAVLSVGETPDFARNYGIIGFVKRGNNLRLEINPTRAINAGLIISGKLASIATLVDDSY